MNRDDLLRMFAYDHWANGECLRTLRSGAASGKDVGPIVKRIAHIFLAEAVDYKNSKGEPWRNRVEDVLTHVIMHSAYHRGQIAMEMRAAGMEPAYTDFIHAVRQEIVQ